MSEERDPLIAVLPVKGGDDYVLWVSEKVRHFIDAPETERFTWESAALRAYSYQSAYSDIARASTEPYICPRDEQGSRFFIVAATGGDEAPSYDIFTSKDEAIAQAREWFADGGESDTVDVLEVDPKAGTITRVEVELDEDDDAEWIAKMVEHDAKVGLPGMYLLDDPS